MVFLAILILTVSYFMPLLLACFHPWDVFTPNSFFSCDLILFIILDVLQLHNILVLYSILNFVFFFLLLVAFVQKDYFVFLCNFIFCYLASAWVTSTSQNKKFSFSSFSIASYSVYQQVRPNPLFLFVAQRNFARQQHVLFPEQLPIHILTAPNGV